MQRFDWNEKRLSCTPFLYLHHRHCQSQDIHLLYPSPPGLPLKTKMSYLQTLLPWPIWSFTFSTRTTPTLTDTLSPPGRPILEIGPELLLTPLWKPLLWFVAALVPWCAWLLSSALDILRLRLPYVLIVGRGWSALLNSLKEVIKDWAALSQLV